MALLVTIPSTGWRVTRPSCWSVALNLPGTGLSRAAAGYRPSIEAAAAVFGAFILALDLRDITLVSHDVGTPVALGATLTMPEKVKAITVTEGFASALADENPSIARSLRIVGGRPVGVLNDAFGHAGDRLRRGCGPQPEPRGPAAMLRDAAEASEYLRRLDSELRATLGDRPILLVFGSASPTVKERFPERWKKSFPDAKLVMVDGGHHFPMNDAPDLVADAIRSWWTSVVASRRGFL